MTAKNFAKKNRDFRYITSHYHSRDAITQKHQTFNQIIKRLFIGVDSNGPRAPTSYAPPNKITKKFIKMAADVHLSK